ncbi:MAG: hypothetical protein Q8R38_07385 [Candidatus Omnitrophota bacterium]|nr:hypothetical protein [Candidatus Omnitrophota bacterium]
MSRISNTGEKNRFKKLSLMGRKYNGIINEISNPIDATNRFINLALHSIGDNSQGRQFLLESKQGIKKTAMLLKRLNDYSKKIESEIREMVDMNE